MPKKFNKFLDRELGNLQAAGLYRETMSFESPQQPHMSYGENKSLINLCSNDYLGLANDDRLKDVARKALDVWGYGAASSRVICGNFQIHRELEMAISDFLGVEDSIVFGSNYLANIGLYEALLDDQDYAFYDELVHPSVLDGLRLTEATPFCYRGNDINDLEDKLKRSRYARFRLITTDGVFLTDGLVAQLPDICELAERYDALVVVNDAHAVGVLGKTGRGSHEFREVADRVDLLTGSLGKALGGAAGGYIAGRRTVISWIRQKARPYLFSNALPPTIAATAKAVFEWINDDHEQLRKLQENISFFRSQLRQAGFQLIDGPHPIVPIVIRDAVTTQRMSDALFQSGVFALGLCYPVVPKGSARIRAQITAAQSHEDLKQATDTICRIGKELGVI